MREERPQQQQVFFYRAGGEMGCLKEFSQLILEVAMGTKQTEMQKERYSSNLLQKKKKREVDWEQTENLRLISSEMLLKISIIHRYTRHLHKRLNAGVVSYLYV